jgi:hypothetical protein
MTKEKVTETKNEAILGKLVSRLNYPESNLKYGDTAICISPMQVINKIDGSKLGNLPKGVIFVPYTNK